MTLTFMTRMLLDGRIFLIVMIAYVIGYQYVMYTKLFCSRQIYKCNKDTIF